MKNPVTRWQVVTPDPEAHSRFYADVFGWDVTADNALNHRQVATGDGDHPDGGFWPAPPEVPAFVQLFVRVEDVEGAMSKTLEHGGEVIIPAQNLPDGEVMAILRDRAGLSFGVYSESC